MKRRDFFKTAAAAVLISFAASTGLAQRHLVSELSRSLHRRQDWQVFGAVQITHTGLIDGQRFVFSQIVEPEPGRLAGVYLPPWDAIAELAFERAAAAL